VSGQPPHVFVHVSGPLTPFEVPPAAAEGTVLDPTWEQVTEPLEPLAREMARLHAPAQEPRLSLEPRYTRSMRVCEGCDWGGWEAEAPEWPCRTAELVLTHLRLGEDGLGVRS
jgi:hypothetical protein